MSISSKRQCSNYAAIIKNLYSQKVLAASKRYGYVYDLSISDYYALIHQPCFYCGITGSGATKDRINPITKHRVSDTVVYHNGIDRIDSNRGYMKDNSVSCC